MVKALTVSVESETYNVEVRLDTEFSFGGLAPRTMVTYREGVGEIRGPQGLNHGPAQRPPEVTDT